MAVILSPGELWFGAGHQVVRTLLGSCVAITLWHPGQRLGGMCHYLLPEPGIKPERLRDDLPGYYGSEALHCFDYQARRHGLTLDRFQAKVFGGGNMFHGIERKVGAADIANRNIEWALHALDRVGVEVVARDVGGYSHRTVVMDVWSGDVWVKQGRIHDS